MSKLMTALLVALPLTAVACEDRRAVPPPGNNTAPASVDTTQVTGGSMPADPMATAANRDRIRENPDDVKITPPRAARLITGFSAAVREAPSGRSMSTVETTADVTEVARDKRGDYYLIIYRDPGDSSKTLAGWVYKGALENTGWSSAPPTGLTGSPVTLECSSGETHLRTDKDFCAKTCSDDSSCSAGQSCDGLAFQVASSGALTSSRYCISTSSTSASSAPATPAKEPSFPATKPRRPMQK